MTSLLWHFIETNRGRFSEDAVKRLLLYVAFSHFFCSQYCDSHDIPKNMKGFLPSLVSPLFQEELNKAAATLDDEMPWGYLEATPELRTELDYLWKHLQQDISPTPDWLQEQISLLFSSDSPPYSAVTTPPTLRSLIAHLSAQQPAGLITDLCCGPFLLGLEVWKTLGRNPEIHCTGEEIDPRLCAVARLLLFASGVSATVTTRNAMASSLTSAKHSCPAVYVADFPLTGNRTQTVQEFVPALSEEKSSFYTDWIFIQSVLNRMTAGDRAFMVVTKGALARQNERALREYLIQQDWLDGVIQLPPGLYPQHNLPLNLLVCQKQRPAKRSGRVFFADLAAFSLPDTRRTQKISPDGIEKLCRAFKDFSCEKGFSRTVCAEQIQESNCSFYPPLYLAEPSASTGTLRLGEVAAVTRGLQLPKGHPPAQTNPRYLLNIRDLQDGEIHYESAAQIEAGPALWESKYRIREDDILLTCKGSALKLVIVPPNPPPAYISGNLTRLRVHASLYSAYLLYEYLCSPAGQDALNLIQTGTTIRVLASSALENFCVPNCPVETALQVGDALKSAALTYRQECMELYNKYQENRQGLLAQLLSGKEPNA